MADDTQINNGTGDLIRDIDRSLNPIPIAAKTQVVQLDAGGANAEALVCESTPLPTIDAYNVLQAKLQYQQLLLAQLGRNNGFIPMEISGFLIGGS